MLQLQLRRGSNLFEILHGSKRLGRQQFLSQAGRIPFAQGVLQDVILIHVKPADGCAVNAEHQGGLIVGITGPVDAVV